MRLKASILVCLACSLVLCSCNWFDTSAPAEENSVLLFYGAGYNNLSSDIKNNVQTISEGDVPKYISKHKLLTYTHLSRTDSDWATPAEGHLVQHYFDHKGIRRTDTLMRVDASRSASDPEVLREVLEKVASLFPDSKYGLIVSSHGTGWLPAGVYNKSMQPLQFSAKRNGTAEDMPVYSYNESEGPKVKTIFAEVVKKNGVNYSQEMSIQSFAKAIPVHLDYLIFDACLMGCVEVAYELKDKADYIGFSPTEVLSTGFNFSDLSMLVKDSPDPEAFCRSYFEMYDSRNSYATISLVKTSGLDALAGVCSSLFAKYSGQIASLTDMSGIQKYYRGSAHWFFDLEDILVKAGIGEEEHQQFLDALNSCVIYRAATPQFISIDIATYSGLGMYLPRLGKSTTVTLPEGTVTLNDFYRTLAWNKATNLVE